MIRLLPHRLTHWAATALGGMAAGILIAVSGLLLADVVARALGRPLFGTQDSVEMALVLMTFGALPLLERSNSHIRVDLFTPLMPRWLIATGDLLAQLLGALLWSALAFAIYEGAALSALLNLASNILKLPKAPFQYAVAGLAMIAALSSLARAFPVTERAAR